MRGLKLPIEYDSGRFSLVENSRKLNQNISNIVNTELLSRIMEPNMGSIAFKMLFRIPNPAIHTPILNKLKDSINTQEPRIRIDSILLKRQSDSERGNGILYIEIIYTIKQTGEVEFTEVEIG
jgi:phage baseplate assembly protein W